MKKNKFKERLNFESFEYAVLSMVDAIVGENTSNFYPPMKTKAQEVLAEIRNFLKTNVKSSFINQVLRERVKFLTTNGWETTDSKEDLLRINEEKILSVCLLGKTESLIFAARNNRNNTNNASDTTNTMNNPLPTLETCKQLESLGFPQTTTKSYYYNCFDGVETISGITDNDTLFVDTGCDLFAAPTVEEIKKALPRSITMIKLNEEFSEVENWAKFWIYLKTNKLI